MSYLSDYANNVSQILLHRGDAQAQAALNRGKIWGTALSQIGETIGGIPAARQLQKDNEQKRADQAQQRQLTGLQMTRAQGQLGDDETARKLAADARNKTELAITAADQWKKGDPTVRAALLDGLDPTVRVDVEKRIDEFDAADLAREEVNIKQGKLMANTVLMMGGTPEDVLNNGKIFAARMGRDSLEMFNAATDNGTNAAKAVSLLKKFATFGEKVEPPKTREVKTVDAQGNSVTLIVDDVSGQSFAGEPVKLTFGTTPVRMMVNGKPVTLRTGSDGFMYDLKGQRVEDENISMPEPTTGTSPRVLTPNAESQLINRLASQWNTAAGMSRELERQVKIMDEGLKASERGDLAQGGQAVLVTFQKILDPTSVVRESEFDRSREGQSLMQRAQGAVERLAQGGPGVPLSELQKYAALARSIAAAQVNGRLPTIKERIGKNADRYSIPRELVFETDAPSLDSKETVTGPKVGDKRTVGTETRTWNGTEWVK